MALLAGLLLLAAALTAWTPLFAFGIAAVVIAGFAVFFAMKGGQEEVEARTPGDTGPADPEDQPEHRPKAQSGSQQAQGVWGEKREA